MHIVGQEPPATERQVARLALERPDLQRLYGGWLASLHPAAWREIEDMARTMGKRLEFDIRPAIESLGLDRVIEPVGLDRLVEQAGIDRIIEEIGVARIVRFLIERSGLDGLVASLSSARRRELKRRLQEPVPGLRRLRHADLRTGRQPETLLLAPSAPPNSGRSEWPVHTPWPEQPGNGHVIRRARRRRRAGAREGQTGKG